MTRSNYKCATGSFAGTGVAQEIVGLSFRPKFVMIKGGANAAVFRVAQNSRNSTLGLGGTGAAAANQILEFTANGFTVGTDAAVNANGTTYYYVAFDGKEGQDYFRTGRYVGDAVDGRNVLRSGIGALSMDIMLNRGAGATSANFRTSSMVGDETGFFGGLASTANLIQGIFEGGFQVGSSSNVNGSGVNHFFAGWKALGGVISTGTYSGNSISGRDVDVGFQPSVFIVKQTSGVNQARMVTSSTGADNTLRMGAAASAAGEILSITSTGVMVGTGASVNASGSTYHWIAFKAGEFKVPTTTRNPSVASPLFVQAYYPKTRYATVAPSSLPLDKLTVVSHFSMVPTTTGGLVDTAGAVIADQAPTLIAAAHAAGSKVTLTIGGTSGADDATWEAAVSDTYRATFVANIVSFVNLYGYDGVDIDWEPMNSSSDAASIIAFIAALRAAMPSPKLITIFLATATSWKWALANSIKGDIDKFILSTYDFSYAETLTVHDSALYSTGSQPATQSVEYAIGNFIAGGVPASQLVVAIPLYAQQWAGETALYASATPNAFVSVAYKDLTGASSTSEPTGALYDADAKGAYVNGDPFTSFASVRSVADRLSYVKENKLGGLAFWEISQAYFSATTPHFPHMEVLPLRQDSSSRSST